MKLFRNWTMHNLFSHPISELVYLVVNPLSSNLADKWSGAIHDCTIPDHEKGTGRG